MRIQPDSLQFNKSRLDFEVVLATSFEGERWILRFPRREDVLPLTDKEKRTLELVVPFLTVEAPRWVVCTDELIAYKAKAYIWEIDETNVPNQYSILGFIQIIRNRNVSQNVLSTSLEAIERNARIQKQFIEDLLEISQILQGKIRLIQCPTNLVHTIIVVITNLYAYAEKKSINLSFSIIDLDQRVNIIDNFISGCNQYQTFSSNFTVCGDPNRLQKVIYNLLDNAIKFTPVKGNIQVQLSIDKSREIMIDGDTSGSSNYVKIQVIDNGIGINSEFLPYVFELFRQADSSITRSSSGLGLGLATVRHITEMHGGEVGVESLGSTKM